MIELVDAVRLSVESKNWFAALFLAITLPDVCGKLESPQAESRKRYEDWFNRYLSRKYAMLIDGYPVVFMAAGDVYAIRCALLHEGSDDVSEQRARETLEKFHFTSSAQKGMYRIGSERGFLGLNVAHFCKDICAGVEAWERDVSTNPEVVARIAAMVRIG